MAGSAANIAFGQSRPSVALSYASAPYTAMAVTITGTTVKGVSLAANAFLEKGLTNGVVAHDGWQRTAKTVLDSQPLSPEFEIPSVLPRRIGPWRLIGLTQCPEPDRRGVLALVDVEPLQMWRSKYYKPGEWDLAGSKESFVSYMNSLHRRAYGNSLLVMQFADPQTAQRAAGRIAGQARLGKRQGKMTTGIQPIPSSKWFRDPGNPKIETWKAPFSVWATGPWVCFSSLPIKVNRPFLNVTSTVCTKLAPRCNSAPEGDGSPMPLDATPMKER